MRNASKGMKYTQRGAGVCSLCNADGCRDTDVVVAEQVFLRGKVVEIDHDAFRNNTQIKSVVLPEGIVSIGDYAFENCKNLERVVLPQSLKSIGRGAFRHCEKLKRIVFPSTITSIAAEAFACCFRLESVDLSHMRAIGKDAFSECDSLKEIAVGDGIEEIYATSFRNSEYYKHHSNWKDGLLYLGKWIIGCKGSMDEYRIKKDTVGIASDVFRDEWHIKRTKNPEYDDAMEKLDTAMACGNAPIPDLTRIPEYFEEIIPVRIRYEGTSEEWRNVIKLRTDQRFPVRITTDDATIEAY